MTLFEFAKGLGLCHCVGAHFYLLLLDMIDMRALCMETFFFLKKSLASIGQYMEIPLDAIMKNVLV